MRVLYYTTPWAFDVTVPFIRAVSRRAELHVVMEVHAHSWRDSMFELPPRDLPLGIVPAGPLISGFPPAVQEYFRDAASLHLAVYPGETSARPGNWLTARGLARHVHALHPDVLHLEGMLGRLLWSLPMLHRLPFVLTVHDPVPHSGELTRRKAFVRRVFFSQARRFILHNRKQLVPFCAAYGVRAECVDAILLGPNEVARHWIAAPVPTEERTLLFFGRLSQYKGLEDFYQAALLASARLPGLKFIVAGRPVPGYEPPPAPQLPNGGSIEVLNQYIDNALLAQLFQRATAVVCPYTDATQSAVVLTAYAFGKPVIATRVGGLPEYVDEGDTGYLVPPRSPELLADATCRLVRRLAEDQTLAGRFGEKIAAKTTTILSWDRIAQQTLAAYGRVCGRESAGYHVVAR